MPIDEKLGAPTATAIRDEVRNTVQQLEKLVGTEKDFNQFCDAVLSKVVKITGAHGALFWQINGESRPQLTHRAGQPPGSAARSVISSENQQHNTAVMDVVRNQAPTKLSSESFGEPNEDGDDSFLMLFTPVFNRTKKCCGALELLQRGDVNPQAQEGYLRFLSQISQLFPKWHEQQEAVDPIPGPPPGATQNGTGESSGEYPGAGLARPNGATSSGPEPTGSDARCVA